MQNAAFISNYLKNKIFFFKKNQFGSDQAGNRTRTFHFAWQPANPRSLIQCLLA